MSIVLNNEVLKNALKKLSGFIGDTIVLECYDTPVQGKENEYLVKIRACNKVAQVSTMISYSGANNNKKLYFTNQFSAVVEALSVFGDELMIEPLDGMAKVSCGTAAVDVPLVPEAAEIDTPDYKKVPTLILQLTKEDFVNAVCQGAYIQDDTTSVTYSRTCFIKPCVKESGKRTVKFSCFNGLMYAECEVDVAIQKASVELFNQWASKGLLVKSPSLTAVARNVYSNLVYLYLTSKQLIIFSGSEVYNFIPVEGTYPLDKLVARRDIKDFVLTLDKNRLKSAFKVIGLYTDAGDARIVADIVMEERENGKVNVSVRDMTGKNHVEFEAEGHGNVSMRLNKDHVNREMDGTVGDVITFYGETGNMPIFIRGENENAFSITTPTKKAPV